MKHTIHFQVLKKSVAELKRKVMEFVNLTMPSKSDPMDLGRFEQEVDEEWEEYAEDADEDGNLNGFGEKCYNCDGFGHYSRECPYKGKSKGKSKSSGGKSFGKAKATAHKGKGKGYDKGKGKGPAAGCFTCGGAHYASACPSSTQSWSQGENLRSLCGLKEVAKPIVDDGYRLVLKKNRTKTTAGQTKVDLTCGRPRAFRSEGVYTGKEAGGRKAEVCNAKASGGMLYNAFGEKSRQERASAIRTPPLALQPCLATQTSPADMPQKEAKMGAQSEPLPGARPALLPRRGTPPRQTG